MFAALAPLVKERSVHVLISAGSDNRLAIYVEPVVKDKENGAFGTPFRCEATPEELDAQFAAVVAKWLNTRSNALKPLMEALAEAEAATKKAAEDSKKKMADAKAKQVAVKVPGKATQAKPATTVTPSLLDSIDDDLDDEGGNQCAAGAANEGLLEAQVVNAAPVDTVPPVEPPVAVAPVATAVEPVVTTTPVASPVVAPAVQAPAAPAATVATFVTSNDTIELF